MKIFYLFILFSLTLIVSCSQNKNTANQKTISEEEKKVMNKMLDSVSSELSQHKGYELKNGKIYHRWVHGGNWSKEYSLLNEADPKTFEEIENNLKNIDFGKDKNHVFVDAEILKNADPSTFVHVDQYYWKDTNNVYLLQFGKQDPIIKGALPKSFEVIDGYLWSKDKKNVYYEFDTLSDVQPSNFKAVNEHWGKDGKYYYYHKLRLDSLDYETAEVISDYYIKDKNKVFFENKEVKGANPSTFVADGVGWFGHDDKYMYDNEKNEGPITEKYRETYIDK